MVSLFFAFLCVVSSDLTFVAVVEREFRRVLAWIRFDLFLRGLACMRLLSFWFSVVVPNESLFYSGHAYYNRLVGLLFFFVLVFSRAVKEWLRRTREVKIAVAVGVRRVACAVNGGDFRIFFARPRLELGCAARRLSI